LRYSMKHVTTDDARVKGRMVSVAPEVSAIVKVLRVDEGSVVKVGDILLELNDMTYRLQLEEAQAQAEMIERQVQQDTKEYVLDIKRAEDQLLQARADLVSKQSALAEERTALVLEIEQTRNQFVEAEAALKESESTVKEMHGQVRIATSNWERAQALFTPQRHARARGTAQGAPEQCPDGPEAHSAPRTQGANAGSGSREGTGQCPLGAD
jgi:membrane fusion protein (multidrug efflux system)